MASTPPAQIRAEACTPPTPLHGSAYHSKSSPSRYNTRSSVQKTPGSAETFSTQSPQSTRTLRSPQRDFHFKNLHSAQFTPQRKSTRRVQVISPASPNSDSITQLPAQIQNSSYLSTTTVLSEGMLPTPVKTPQKNKDIKPNMAARALFQDQSTTNASPRKQKKRRHNGFSLESFAENNDAQSSIPIFTDSRDQIPEVDAREDNPFYVKPEDKQTSSQKVRRISKRRKVSAEKPLDPQVEDAIRNDEGMVYVFRGKKVYRRFEDLGDEEEVIDPEELGLLQRERDVREIITPLKTLTRKSIRPRRLFQTEVKQQQKSSQTDEEAETEIEDHQEENASEQEQPSPSRATRSKVTKVTSATGSKKSSPFDSWPRLKSGGRSSSSVPASKGRKRTAAEALEA